MTIDVYSSAGAKKGTWDLPAELFEAPVNQGLMHQAVMMQQSNRRKPIAHAKSRGEVVGSTRKVYAQKHTGRARRGPIRSPVMRGGGKAFGPKKERNFRKDMPRAMRQAALRSSLSLQAKKGVFLGLENYPETIKTKEAATLLGKLPVELGRKILIVVPAKHEALTLSMRNIPNITMLLASYLNPEDILASRHVIFLGGALEKAMEVFSRRTVRVKAQAPSDEKKPMKPKKSTKKTSVKKKTTHKNSTPAPSRSSESSASPALPKLASEGGSDSSASSQ